MTTATVLTDEDIDAVLKSGFYWDFDSTSTAAHDYARAIEQAVLVAMRRATAWRMPMPVAFRVPGGFTGKWEYWPADGQCTNPEREPLYTAEQMHAAILAACQREQL